MKSSAAMSAGFRSPYFLDLLGRAAAVTFFGFFALRMFAALLETGSPLYFILFASEFLVVMFSLLRRATRDVSQRGVDWAVALAGTNLPLLAQPGGVPLAPEAVSAALMIFGLLASIWAKLSLRRSFGIVAANRGVKTSGPYTLIRHPMYAGYLVIQVGFLLFSPTLWNLLIYVAAASLQLLRMQAEEEILRQDPTYRDYADRVRYRLVPGLY